MKYVKFAAIKRKKKPHLHATRIYIYKTDFCGSRRQRTYYEVVDGKFMLPLPDDFYTNVCDGGGYATVEYSNKDGSVTEEVVLQPESF